MAFVRSLLDDLFTTERSAPRLLAGRPKIWRRRHLILIVAALAMGIATAIWVAVNPQAHDTPDPSYLH